MKRPLIRLLALAPMLWLCSAGFAQTGADPRLSRLLGYYLEVFYVKRAVAQNLQERTADEPELRALATDAAAQFDLGALAARIARPLAQSLPVQDASACLAFIESADGDALRSASAKAGEPARLMGELNALPVAQQRAIAGFLESDCSKRTLAVMTSAESKRITGEYGKELTCGYFARTDAARLQALKQHGECPNH